MRVGFQVGLLSGILHMSDPYPHSYNANRCHGHTMYKKASRLLLHQRGVEAYEQGRRLQSGRAILRIGGTRAQFRMAPIPKVNLPPHHKRSSRLNPKHHQNP